jgi:formylglycine-generating enzyme required for sulfatase activity
MVFALLHPSAQADVHGDRQFQECPDCPAMVGIPAGTFAMGSPASEQGRFQNEGPQHYVKLRAFALGKYDVTSEQFQNFLTATGYQPLPCNPRLNLLARGMPRLERCRSLHSVAQHDRPCATPRACRPQRPISSSERSGVGVCRARRDDNRAMVG